MSVSDDLERPLATPEQERLARDIFPVHLSPGEYAARYGDAWAGYGYAAYRYRDARLDRWLQTVARITAAPELLAKVRARFWERAGEVGGGDDTPR